MAQMVKSIIMTFSLDYDLKKRIPGLFLIFQLGENLGGADHFPSWKLIQKGQIFLGTDH